jgi:hypothetical protein
MTGMASAGADVTTDPDLVGAGEEEQQGKRWDSAGTHPSVDPHAIEGAPGDVSHAATIYDLTSARVKYLALAAVSFASIMVP